LQNKVSEKAIDMFVLCIGRSYWTSGKDTCILCDGCSPRSNQLSKFQYVQLWWKCNCFKYSM